MHGGERDRKVFREKDVTEPDDGDVFRNFEALFEEQRGGTNRDEVVAGEDSRGARSFIQHLQRGCLPFLDGIAGTEDKAFIQVDVVLAKGALVAIQAFLVPGRNTGAREVSDVTMAKRDEVLSGRISAEEVFRFHARELRAKRSFWSPDYNRSLASREFLKNRCGRSKAINRGDDETINAPGEESADDRLFTGRIIEAMREDDFITKLISLFFDCDYCSREDRISDRGDDEANSARGPGAKPLCERIGNVAHFVRKHFDAGFGGGGDVMGVAQDLGDSHDGDAGPQRYVLEPNHLFYAGATPVKFLAKRPEE